MDAKTTVLSPQTQGSVPSFHRTTLLQFSDVQAVIKEPYIRTRVDESARRRRNVAASMTTTISYRKLNSEDAEEFKALRIEASSDSPASFYPDAEELRQTAISDFRTQITPSEFQSVYGAFVHGELAGIAGLRRDAMKKIRHRATIWGVYTRARYRRQGISRELMRVLLDDVVSSGEVLILSLSVHSRNIAAKALYRSIGFEAFGLQRHSILVDGEYVDEELMDLRIREPR